MRARIAALADVEAVQLDTEWVERLNAMLEVLRRFVWLTGGLLGLGVIVIVGNTIRLDILNRRAEIEVMKLVGATDGFARRPFLYSGVWYGLGGGLGALAVVAHRRRGARQAGRAPGRIRTAAIFICGASRLGPALGVLGSPWP